MHSTWLDSFVPLLKKIVKIFFLISLLIFLFLAFYKPPLPKESEVIPDIKNSEPLQTPLPANQSVKTITTKIGKYEYKLTPVFNYQLKGLVVSDYASENIMDVRHKDDPGNIKDVCVVWGENVTNGSYREVKFSSGEFTCFYRWDKPLKKDFSGYYFSNNHLIPQTAAIADKIRKSKIGDQISLKGMLVSYEVYLNNEKLFERGTSTTRDDTLNGACETIFVTDFDIIKENYLNFKNYTGVFGFASLISGFLGILLFLFA